VRQSLRLFAAVVFMASGFAGQAGQSEYDPTKVSDSLKAVFRFHSLSTKKAMNANTVTLLTGTIGGTYVQFGADLASVLDDDGKLRVLPITGRGSVQSVADILFLKGVDLGIVRADTLDYLEKKGIANDIKKQFTYVTKLYNEEMQVIAPKAVKTLRDLDGKTVSVDLPNGGTFVTALTVFERLGINANFVYIEQRIAMEKLKKGDLDAVIVVGGKPYLSVTTFNNDGRFHLAGVDYAKPLQSDYLPARLTSKDYPNLIPAGEMVETIAVPAVLAAYNWVPNTERHRKLALFVDAFFTKFAALQNPPFHSKWKEVSLTAPLAGWNRLPLAQQWLDQHGIEPVKQQRFEAFLQENPAAANIQSEADKEALFRQFQAQEDKEALFRRFQAWEDGRNARAQMGSEVETNSQVESKKAKDQSHASQSAVQAAAARHPRHRSHSRRALGRWMEQGAVAECEHQGHSLGRADPDVCHHRAGEEAWQNPFPGASPPPGTTQGILTTDDPSGGFRGRQPVVR
jgi:TRAP transporter TAXI family solute receptor